MASPNGVSLKVRFGAFEADRSAGKLFKAGIPIKLQPQPFRVLLLLAEHSGQVVTRDEIQRHVWGDSTFVDFERGINFSINQIRAALCDTAEQPRYIETLPRVGYRFIASVTCDGLTVPASNTAFPLGQDYQCPRADAQMAQSAMLPRQADTAAREHLQSWWKQQKLPAVVVISALVLLATGFAARRLLRSGSSSTPDDIRISRLTEGRSVADVAISPDGHYVVYALAEKGGQALWLRQVATGSDVRILTAGAEFHGLTFSPDGNYIFLVRSDPNDPYFKYLFSMPVLGGAVRKLITDVDSPVSFSPDGEKFVYEHCTLTGNDIELKITNADGSGDHLLAMLRNGSSFLFQPGPSWSPDGQTIAVPVLHGGKLKSWVLDMVSTTDGSVRELYSSPSDIGRPAWLSDGESLLVPHFDPTTHRSQLWSISLSRGEARPFTKDLADYSFYLDITRDRRTAATIATRTLFHIWVAPARDLSQARQVTSDDLPLFFIAEAFDGKLLTVGGGSIREGQQGGLWIMNADGSQRARFTDVQEAGWLTPCGRFVVFTSYEPGSVSLMRVDRDGTHSSKLASRNPWGPACSPDGKFVFYATVEQPHKIWKVPVEGGTATKVDDALGDQLGDRLAISPDGKLLAYFYTQYGRVPSEGWSLAVVPISGGPPVENFKMSGDFRDLRWSPDGKSLQYLLKKNGATNVWEQPLTGAQPRQLTKFTSGDIFDFNWSADHTKLLMTRGSVSSDVILLSNLR